MPKQPKPNGRPPKLSERDRAEIGRRLAMGEKAIHLAKEFKVSRALISTCFSKQTPTIQKLGADLASVEVAIAALPVSEQVSVRSLADQLKGISSSLARAAQSGSNVAAKLAQIAEKRAEMLDHTSEAEDLKPVAAMMETANRASTIGMGLLGATKTLKDPIDAPPASELTIKLVKPEE